MGLIYQPIINILRKKFKDLWLGWTLKIAPEKGFRVRPFGLVDNIHYRLIMKADLDDQAL